jgi:wyosine [tRNA(Phe)-imidazoG37] synthetase (radical SAM superfamily)
LKSGGGFVIREHGILKYYFGGWFVAMSQSETASERMASAWKLHDRCWKDNRYVYPVVSRRSDGLSIGLNLMPGKACNFDCAYCQVNREIPSTVPDVDLARLEKELDSILYTAEQGSLYNEAPFNVLKSQERGIRDIAFSGDGEPTLYSRFQDAVQIAARMRHKHNLNAAQLVLITNASCLDRPSVRSALEILDDNNGEIWAKLDAGTEKYFQRVNRSRISLEQILENILGASRLRPLVIQSLWFRIQGCKPPVKEIEAYCRRLNALLAAGGHLKAIQIYTIARDPAEADVSPLANDELAQIAAMVSSTVAVPIETYK